MSKQSQHVLIALPHPLLHLVSLGLVSFIFTLFSLELSQFGTQLAPLWFPTSIMMVAFYRHAGRMWPGVALICSLGKGMDIIVGACGSLEWRHRCSFYPLGRYRLFAALPRKHRLTSRDRLEVSNLHEKSSVMRAAGDVPKLDALRRMLETEHLQIEIINTAYFCDATVFDACVHI